MSVKYWFNFSHGKMVLKLTRVKNWYQILTHVRNWYQIITGVTNWYLIGTDVRDKTVKNWNQGVGGDLSM